MTVMVCWTTVAVGATRAATETPRAAPMTADSRLLRAKDGATTGGSLVVALLELVLGGRAFGFVVIVRTMVYVRTVELV